MIEDKIIKWLQDWFDVNGKDCRAIIGISGGKDSSIMAALCKEALGANRVYGILLPDGEQKDIDIAKDLVTYLAIPYDIIDISKITKEFYNSQLGHVSEQARQNLPPRVRMTMLYYIAQSCNGRVIETSNYSEKMIGWETRWGDSVGDVAPFADLTATEVKELGYKLGLPERFIEKAPSDGLCGQTDEEKFGFTYKELDTYIRTGKCENQKAKDKILIMIQNSKFKRLPIPKFINK